VSSEPIPGRRRCAPRKLAARAAIFAATLAGGLLPSGCKSLSLPKVSFPASTRAQAFAPDNHVHAGVRRVAVLPLHTAEWRAAEVAILDTALRDTLAGTERFEITPVSRAELARRFGHESFASSSALPADFLSRLRTDFGVDGVLFLDLTHYGPYQPVAIGLRAKLVTSVEGTALWSFDSLFDSAQADVATAARRYSANKRRPATAAEDNTGVLQSPGRFAKFVGHAAFATLPPRQIE
jgi:hypothetical protein